MTSKTTNKFSPEVRARAVRMVLDHASEHPSRWAAVTSIAAKIGCTPQTLHDWVKKAEVDRNRHEHPRRQSFSQRGRSGSASNTDAWPRPPPGYRRGRCAGIARSGGPCLSVRVADGPDRLHSESGWAGAVRDLR